MKTNKFENYLKKRLNQEEIAEIERQAKFEHTALKALQTDVAKAIADYMQQEDVGFNELVRRLDISPAQLSKIQKGEANLTLSSLAHIFALLNREPHLVLKKISKKRR